MKDFEKEMEKWESLAKKYPKELSIKDDYDSSMDSKYYFSAGKIGATASPQVANQIGELNSRLNQGLRAVELGTLNQRLLDQVPKEHFTEMRRMAKLTGAEPSLHAPIQDLDLAGFTQQGWDPNERKRKVEQLKSVVKRAHMMDPEGNTPITIHAGTFPAQKWQKEWGESVWRDKEGKPVEDKRSEMTLVNPHTGEVRHTRYRERLRIGREEPEAWTPERQMDNMNETSWDQEQFQLLHWKKQMNEKDDMTNAELVRGNYDELVRGKKASVLTPDEERMLARLETEKRDNFKFKSETYHLMRSSIEDMYERFEKYPYKEGNVRREEYDHFKKYIYPQFKESIEKGEKEIEKSREGYLNIIRKMDKERETKTALSKYESELKGAEEKFNQAMFRQTETLSRVAQEMPAPRLWKPVNEFAMEETSTSLAEAALNSYKEYGKNSPMLLLENVYPEFSLSRADSLRETIETAQKKFAEKLMREEKINKREAMDVAKRIIGVTWDVGHIYMLKRSGYTDKDIRKEAEKIAPYVKHLHLTDNFGFEDSHLPPGLGEVNIREQLKAMEKIHAGLGSSEDFKNVRGIVEAGEFVANYKEVPHLYALSHLGSPMYAEDVAPYWHQAWDTYGNYFGSYGELLPQKYFDLYGAPGFSQLPAVLGGGGAGGGERGRFASGTGVTGATTSEET